MNIIKAILGGKDGFNPAWMVKLFPNKRLKELVTMSGITDAQQRALYHLAQSPSDENLRVMKGFFEELEAAGGLPLCDADGNKIKYKRDELPSKTKTGHIQIPRIEGFNPYAIDELNHLYRTGQITREQYDKLK